MMLAFILSLAALDLNKDPGVICTVANNKIVVRFGKDLSSGHFVMDKFAVVQAGSLRGGEWLDVVDPTADTPLRLSPYRPGMKRLVIDTRRQLAVYYSRHTGKARIVPAFPRPGSYTLVFSDDLETELENKVFWACTVGVRQAAGSRVAPGRVEARSARR